MNKTDILIIIGICVILIAVTYKMYKSTNNIEPYKSDVTVTTDVEVKREMNVEVIQSGIIENVITVSTENVNTELNQCVDDMLSGL